MDNTLPAVVAQWEPLYELALFSTDEPVATPRVPTWRAAGVSLLLHGMLLGLLPGFVLIAPAQTQEPPVLNIDLTSLDLPAAAAGTPGPADAGPATAAAEPPAPPAAVHEPTPPLPKEPPKPQARPKPHPAPVKAIAAKTTPTPPKPEAKPQEPAPEPAQPSKSPETANAARPTEQAAADTGNSNGAGTGASAAGPRGAAVGGSGLGGTGGGHGNGSGNGSATFGGHGGPRFLRRILPEYPASARRQGREGLVVVMLSLTETGYLKDAEVVRSAAPDLDAAALDAARRSSYLPAEVDGKTIACRAQLPIRFRLRD